MSRLQYNSIQNERVTSFPYRLNRKYSMQYSPVKPPIWAAQYLFWKPYYAKTLIAQAKTRAPIEILREIFRWKCPCSPKNPFSPWYRAVEGWTCLGVYTCSQVLTFCSINCLLCMKRFQAFHWDTHRIFLLVVLNGTHILIILQVTFGVKWLHFIVQYSSVSSGSFS